MGTQNFLEKNCVLRKIPTPGKNNIVYVYDEKDINKDGKGHDE